MSIIRYASSDSLGTASLCSQGSAGERVCMTSTLTGDHFRRGRVNVALSMLLR